MGTGSLTARASGDIIVASFFNDFSSALEGDFVGRDTSGAATSGQNLGTAALPWGTIRASSLILNGSVVDSSLSTAPQNRVASGKVRTTSSQPAYLIPTASLAFQVLASATNLVYDVNGTTVTATTDITKTGITAAPAADNTCLINDATAAAQADTRIWGEFEVRKELVVDTMGSNMQNKVGQWIAFKIAGGATEYAFGFLESSVKISRVNRGFFVNSSGAPINRTTLSNNDTLTILTLGWVFMDDDGTTVDVSYTNPVWSYSSPSSPATGDYWYDLANQTWKRYDGASFQIIGRTFIGVICADTTAVVGARAVDFYSRAESLNTVDLEISTTEIVRARNPYARLNVAGTILDFGSQLPTWNITTQLATSADLYSGTEQASRVYYLYISKTGQCLISDMEPYYKEDIWGWYHPHNTWRCVGAAYNDGSSNLVTAEATAYPNKRVALNTGNGHGAVNTAIRRFTNVEENTSAFAQYTESANLGASVKAIFPGTYEFHYADYKGSSYDWGLTLNSANLTTAITSIAAAEMLAISEAATPLSISRVITLKRGDVVRPHDDTSGSNASLYNRLYAARTGHNGLI